MYINIILKTDKKSKALDGTREYIGEYWTDAGFL